MLRHPGALATGARSIFAEARDICGRGQSNTTAGMGRAPCPPASQLATPQDLSLIDARRAVAMFARVEVPVIGIVENMSYFICPHCQGRSDIFAHGGARHEAERLGVPFLGEVPLDMAIRETSDSGRPVVAVAPDGPHAAAFQAVARGVASWLAGGQGARPVPAVVFD